MEHSDVLLKELRPGSAIHAAASRIQVRSENNDITDIVDSLDINVRTFLPSDSLFRRVEDQHDTWHPDARWRPTFRNPFYIVAGIASAVNIDTKEAISHQPAIAAPLDAGIGTAVGTGVYPGIEASYEKGKGVQTPLKPSGYREVFAYQLHKINRRGEMKKYDCGRQAFL